MSETTYYTMPQVARMIGVEYDKVRWAALRQVVNPRRIGRTLLFTAEQVETLKTHLLPDGGDSNE